MEFGFSGRGMVGVIEKTVGFSLDFSRFCDQGTRETCGLGVRSGC